MQSVCLLAAALSFTAMLPAAAPPMPRPAPTFSFTDAGGRQISISKFKGKVVLIQFLDTGCSHCQALSRMLTKLQVDYGAQGFQALGVAFNEATPDMVTKYIRDQQVNFPVGFASRESVFACLGVSELSRLMVPQVMLIDRSSVVQAQTDPLGTPELQDESHLRTLIKGLLRGGRH